MIRPPAFTIGGILGGLVTAVLLIAVGILTVRENPAPGEAGEHQPSSIVRAVFADDRLWLLHEGGRLASLFPDASRADTISMPGKVIEICKLAGGLAAITVDGSGWTIRRFSSGRWAAREPVAIADAGLVASHCAVDRDELTLITDRSLIDIRGVETRTVALSERIEPADVATVALAEGESMWVGFNNGEWGGGLKRIGRRDGEVRNVTRNASGTLCGGPLNKDCDPVNGIVPAPGKPGCIVAAVGLTHMLSHGRLVEICGSEIRSLYFKALDPQPPFRDPKDDEPGSTVAFYGLVPNGDALWIVGNDGLYRWSGKTTPHFQRLPNFEARAGYHVSFAVPGVALVLTSANQKVALSGAVPLIVAR